MLRSDFKLDDFTRVAWASSEAEEVWAAKIRSLSDAWQSIEIWSVILGERTACIQSATPESLPLIVARCAAKGITVIPLEQQGVSGTYTASSVPVQEGRKWQYRIAYVKSEFATRFSEAWVAQDNEVLGFMLGYPKCCRDFFKKIWIDDQGVDTTWQMTGVMDAQDVTLAPEDYDRRLNVLLRWLGVRLVSHLPCSFKCQGSIDAAEKFIKVGLAKGMKEEIHRIQEMLDWPVEWSALHGAAEIKTPILKIVTRTDATPIKYTVRLAGGSYPREGAKGNVFPFKKVLPFRLSEENVWADNGFPTMGSMEEAHDPILQIFDYLTPTRILDLGCGNGYLLKQLARRRGDLLCFGLDHDGRKIGNAKRLFPGGAFRTGDLHSTDWGSENPDIVLLMPGRLLEVDGPARRLSLQKLRESTCRALVIYTYGWRDQFSLVRLYHDSGLNEDWVDSRSLSNRSCQVAVLLRVDQSKARGNDESK